MITDMIYLISTFIDDDSFIKTCGFIKDKKINERRIRINRKRVANSLNLHLLGSLGIVTEADISFFKAMINEIDDFFTFQDLFMYLANDLLDKKSNIFMYRYNYSKHPKMNYTYVTRGSFYGGLKIHNQYKKKIDKPVCAVYRLPIVKKNYLNTLNPIVKALIY
jgi:hypothetical protein